MDRTSPSSACRAAAWAGESAADGGSARISTRPLARSRFTAGARKSCAPARSAGVRRPVASRITAAGFSPSPEPSAVTGDCTCTPSAWRSSVSAFRSRPSPAEPMTAGPGSSACPGSYRRRTAGRGRPSCLVMVVPTPELAKLRYQSLTLCGSFRSSRFRYHKHPSFWYRKRGRSGLEDGDDALAAGGADGDQAALARARLVQRLGELGDDPAAGRRERVPGRQGRAVDIQLRAVDRAERGVQAQLALGERRVLPGLQG